MIQRYILLSIFAITATGCAGREVVKLPTTVDVPQGWPNYSQKVLGDSECPRISGIYTEPPIQWSSPGSHYGDTTYERYGYITMMPFDSVIDEIPVTSEINYGAEEFKIVQTEGQEFLFQDRGLKGEAYEEIFSQERGSFTCKNSRMYFPLVTLYYADQSGSYNLQYLKYLAIDEVGDLVLVRITGPYMSSILGNSPRIEYDFMKYSRVRD